MINRMLAGMIDQQAPSPVRHCSAVDNQRLSMNAHFTKGGITLYRKKSITIVRTELKTPLKRLDFTHCRAPILMTGAPSFVRMLCLCDSVMASSIFPQGPSFYCTSS